MEVANMILFEVRLGGLPVGSGLGMNAAWEQ